MIPTQPPTDYVAMAMKHLFITTVLIATISCSNSDDLASFINEDPKKYNDQIQQWSAGGEHWTNDPLILTRELFRSGDFERRVILTIEEQTKDKVTVTITREGLEDDSVDGEKRIMEFERTNNRWRIKTIRVGFRCWKGRGHTHYSGRFCS